MLPVKLQYAAGLYWTKFEHTTFGIYKTQRSPRSPNISSPQPAVWLLAFEPGLLPGGCWMLLRQASHLKACTR